MEKRLLSGFLAIVTAIFLFSSLGSCSKDEDLEISVASVSMSQASLNLEVGATASLTATVSPSDATNKAVSWTSSNSTVATVSNGVVTAVSEGSATITAMAGGKSATCLVTVKAKPEEKVLVVGNAATVSAAGATVEVDVQYNVEYTVEVEASAQSWIHYVETRAVQSGKLVFNVDANDGDERSGKVTLKDKSGTVDPVTITITQEQTDAETSVKKALMKIYDAMDGPNWKMTNKWDLSKPLSSWDCVSWYEDSRGFVLDFEGETGLKGEFPDCFGELTLLDEFFVQNETGVKGKLPPSFNKLKNLKFFALYNTSMTSLPEVFEGMNSLVYVNISGNHLMTGSLPESLGRCTKLVDLAVGDNAFTGTVPDSWARLGTGLVLQDNHFR